MSHRFTVRQRCTVIERTSYHVTLPKPAEVYLAESDGEYEDLADVLEAAVGGEIEDATVTILSNDHDDDPACDFNEFDNAEVVDWDAPKESAA